MWQIRESPEGSAAKSILTPTSGFIKEAGFTHSLSPARNCTYGCTYCYVPTMGIYGGLRPEDSKHWGQFTTFKTNAAELVASESRSGQVIYCSPLVDPYQPAERDRALMPQILEAILRRPPKVFVVQTRGPLVLRDLAILQAVAKATTLRISFSITTNREDVRRRYEPHCESNQERLEAVTTLRDAGIEVYATLAPLLPCDPERLAEMALRASGRSLIGDPLHTRQTKARGATTRAAACGIARRFGEEPWFRAEFQGEIVARIRAVARKSGYEFAIGPSGFARLARI